MWKFAAIFFLLLISVIIIPSDTSLIANFGMKGQIMSQQLSDIPPLDIDNLSITVVYDNNPHKQGLKTEWGFSAW